MDGLIKIVLTGPESSGKSRLGKELARHFKGKYVPEYARKYLEEYGSEYDFSLLGKMALEHKAHQEELLSKARDIVFLDTDLINYVVWEQLVFRNVHNHILEKADEETDHRYLITFPDLGWEPDPLRENPNGRIHIFDWHVREIVSRKRPYRIVKGRGQKRLENAIKAVEELIRIPLAGK